MKYLRLQVQEIIRDCSSLGSSVFVFLVVGILFLKDYRYGLEVLFVWIVVEVIGNLIKWLYHKKRPNEQSYSNILEKIDSGSYPSIHSARATLTSWMLHSTIGFPLLFSIPLVFLVAISRLWLRRHYLIDILSGCALGLAIAYLVSRLSNS